MNYSIPSVQLLRVVDSPQKISRRFKAEFPTLRKVLLTHHKRDQIYYKFNWIFAKSEKKGMIFAKVGIFYSCLYSFGM